MSVITERGRRCNAAFAVAGTILLLLSGAASAAKRPKTIPLPNGFRPEGIATRGASTFYVGSIPTGAIYRGDLVTGEGAEFVPGQEGRSAVGLGLRAGMLFVSGGGTGDAYVYDTSTGSEIAELTLTDAEETFINDVDATSEAAYFTDSVNQVMYRVPIEGQGDVGEPQTIELTGELQYTEGFNVNGIDSTRDGAWLVVVQSNTGKLFRVDANSGETTEIDLGGEAVEMGDGILLDRPDRLWVLQNRINTLTRIEVQPDLSSGRVVSRKVIDGTDVPTTLSRSRDYLALVNARFGNESPDTAEYWVTQIYRPR